MTLTRSMLSLIQAEQHLSMFTVLISIILLGAFACDCGNDEFFDPYTNKCDPCGPVCTAGDCLNVCANYSMQTYSPATTTEIATTTTIVTVTSTENSLDTYALIAIIVIAGLFLLVVALLFIMIYIKFCRKKKNVRSLEVTTKPIEETAKESNPETVALTNGIYYV